MKPNIEKITFVNNKGNKEQNIRKKQNILIENKLKN